MLLINTLEASPARVGRQATGDSSEGFWGQTVGGAKTLGCECSCARQGKALSNRHFSAAANKAVYTVDSMAANLRTLSGLLVGVDDFGPGREQLPAHLLQASDNFTNQGTRRLEIAVGVVVRWVPAALRHRKFFAIAELNKAIAVLLERLNQRLYRKQGGSRSFAVEPTRTAHR